MYTIKKGIGAGAIGGIVAGIVMLVPMMSMMSMMNLPSDLFPKLVGMTMNQPPESASMLGIGIHFVSSVTIGIIFGAVISTRRLAVTSFKKGVGIGIATGAIAYIVLFLPMITTVLPPTMMGLMQMMNPGAPQDMIMQQLQAMQPMLFSGSAISHLIFGAVLGIVASLILIRKVTCPQCGQKMSKNEMVGHACRAK